MNEIEKTETETGTVSAIAFGGMGIVRQQSQVIFIPFTAIGDVVRFRITKRKKNYANGEVVEIIQPSTQRTLPLCPYFGTCGGCQLQHINYQAQLDAKRQWIEDALKRQAGIEDVIVPNVIPTEQQWAYRRRIVLTLKEHEGHFNAGYIANDNKSLLTVDSCPIFVPKTTLIIEYIQEIAQKLTCQGYNSGKVTVLKQNETTFLVHFHFKFIPKNAKEILQKIPQQYPCITGVVASAPRETIRYGNFETSFKIDDLNFDFSPQAFIQSHPEQSLNIYRTICEQALIIKPKKVLDLYCGIGISSLLLAQQGSIVIGVEANIEAVRLATENALKNNLRKTTFSKANVEDVLESLLKKEIPDLVIVNPPREGLDARVVEALKATPPSRIMYISCMPSTLARDIKPLIQAGYTLKYVQGFDMFPQTAHVETLILLERGP